MGWMFIGSGATMIPIKMGSSNDIDVTADDTTVTVDSTEITVDDDVEI